MKRRPVQRQLRRTVGAAPTTVSTTGGSAGVPAKGESVADWAHADGSAYDEGLWGRARTQWQFGDWRSLAALDGDAIGRHPERPRLALLAASGHQQLGDMAMALRWGRTALTWGCPRKLVAQVLTAGVHNTLGRAAVLLQDDRRIKAHFQSAVGPVDVQQAGLIGHARMVREMGRMHLLPQALRLIEDEIDVAGRAPAGADSAANISMLRTELGLLSHELSLALQRRQLGTGSDGAVVPAAGAESIDGIRRRSLAQLGQDVWVLERSGFKRDGFFVEFGATDGVLLSNTWLLEHDFGWRGLCAEPNPKFFGKLRTNRRCTLSDACIGGRTGQQVEFIFANEFGGMARHAHDDEHGDKRDAYRAAGDVAMLTTISLEDFLLQHGAPREIDYLSIDTEGSEYEILASFPFNRWDVRLITVEHNSTPRRTDIRALLEGHGYRCTEMQWDDWYERTAS